MNNGFTVFKYELKNALKSKTFITSVIVMSLMIIIGGLIARYFTNDSEKYDNTLDYIESEMMGKDEDGSESLGNIGYIIENDSLLDEDVKEIYSVFDLKSYENKEDIESDLKNKKLDVGLIFGEDLKLKVLYKSIPYDDPFGYKYGDIYENYLVNSKLKSEGIDIDKVYEIKEEMKVDSELISLESNNFISMIISFILSLILYIIIIITGQVSSMNVAREKNDRTMELLITSTKPKHLINGKVFASFVQSLVLIISLLISGIIVVIINKEKLLPLLQMFNYNIDYTFLLIFLAFFVFGYIMYLYIYAALGATVSNTEEINTAIGPINFILILVYFGVLISIVNPNPNNTLLKVFSFIPFSSPFTMHARYAMAPVPMEEVFISLGILILTSVILSIISVKIYRSSSLNYGNRNKFRNRLRRIFKK